MQNRQESCDVGSPAVSPSLDSEWSDFCMVFWKCSYRQWMTVPNLSRTNIFFWRMYSHIHCCTCLRHTSMPTRSNATPTASSPPLHQRTGEFLPFRRTIMRVLYHFRTVLHLSGTLYLLTFEKHHHCLLLRRLLNVLKEPCNLNKLSNICFYNPSIVKYRIGAVLSPLLLLTVNFIVPFSFLSFLFFIFILIFIFIYLLIFYFLFYSGISLSRLCLLSCLL